jgi:hypothetical protein
MIFGVTESDSSPIDNSFAADIKKEGTFNFKISFGGVGYLFKFKKVFLIPKISFFIN